jgi:hypothetical protein
LGTDTSTEPISGTLANPISRQAAAGKAAVKSAVEVKKTETTSEGEIALDFKIEPISSWTPEAISVEVFASTWIAPRIPRIAMG